MIGHKGHPEVEGTMGQSEAMACTWSKPPRMLRICRSDPEHLSFVTQTTLSVDDATVVIDALKQRFPDIQGPKKDDICYATQNRQDAVKALAEQCDLVIVVGSPNSSNSRRLKEVAIGRGVAAYLVDGADEIDLIMHSITIEPSTSNLASAISRGPSLASRLSMILGGRSTS
jgi:4-hydroxy-3-methylbut-2-enyl diphosphate reductase